VKATLYKSPDSVAEFNRCGVITTDDDVVVSGSIVTANGPGSAKKFGEKVAELLFKE
jgi:putative intracellular protease/amidase